MKRSMFRLLALAGVSLTLTACGETKLDFRNAQISNGQIYSPQENEPFTGLVTNMPEETIRLADDFNNVLVVFNRTMGIYKAASQSIIGRRLVCSSEIEDGYLTGLTTCFIPNSKVKRYTAQYNSGSLDGNVEIFALDGATVLAKASFKEDRNHGTFEIFGPNNGKKVVDHNSVNGLLDGEQRHWDENTGNVTYYAKAENGRYVGLVETFRADGMKTSEVPYVDGQRKGVMKVWDEETGNLIIATTVVGAANEGPAKRWDKDGNLTSSGIYKKNAWYPDPVPQDTQPEQVASSSKSCSEQWIDAFHAENGENALINNEQLGEWDQWCAEGKLPN